MPVSRSSRYIWEFSDTADEFQHSMSDLYLTHVTFTDHYSHQSRYTVVCAWDQEIWHKSIAGPESVAVSR